MRLLGFIFAGMFMYGMLTAHYGAGLMALGMVLFTAYGSRQLDKRDAEFLETPGSAQPPANADTLQALQEQGTEAARCVL